MEIRWQTKWRAKSLLCINGQSLARGQNQTEKSTCNVIFIKQTYTNFGEKRLHGVFFLFTILMLHVFCLWIHYEE
jgi:hypothetical protein